MAAFRVNQKRVETTKALRADADKLRRHRNAGYRDIHEMLIGLCREYDEISKQLHEAEVALFKVRKIIYGGDQGATEHTNEQARMRLSYLLGDGSGHSPEREAALQLTMTAQIVVENDWHKVDKVLWQSLRKYAERALKGAAKYNLVEEVNEKVSKI